MAPSSVFIISAALMKDGLEKDGKILAKMNMRDEHRAKDNIVVLTESDELFDEALTYAVSYIVPLQDGGIEMKARIVETDSARGLESASRSKMTLPPDSSVCQRLKRVAGNAAVGKQIWLDPSG